MLRALHFMLVNNNDSRHMVIVGYLMGEMKRSIHSSIGSECLAHCVSLSLSYPCERYIANRKLSWWVMNQRSQRQLLKKGKRSWLTDDRSKLFGVLFFNNHLKQN